MGKLSCCAVLLTVSACGGGGDKTPDAAVHDSGPNVDAPVETLGTPPALAIPCTDAAADVYTLPSGLPAMSDSHRGDVFHCATTESLSTYKVNAQITAYNVGYPIAEAANATSGFWTFRIAYRSERTTNTGRAEGDMAAYLLVPEHPLAGAPLVVFGHGSVGIAPKCAPTHLDLSGAVDDQDFPSALLKFAGAGYTVIAPDYSGFSYNQPPGYFIAEDEAHGILDATRAAAKVLPSPPSKVVFVGHSQGGHAVVAAQSYAESYGHSGTLVGVATFAPFWASLSLFGAATTTTAGLMTGSAGDTSSILYSMEYAYSEGELNVGSGGGSGTGHGVDVFQTAKQTAAKDAMLGGECYDMAKLEGLGATPGDFFDTNYVNDVGNSCSLSGNCGTGLAPAWLQHWIDERPAIDTTGAPMLVMFGGQDTFVTPGRAQCVQNKINGDLGAGSATTATVTYCQNPAAAHRDLVRTSDVEYVMSWINARAGIGSDPAACTAPPPKMCPPIPVND